MDMHKIMALKTACLLLKELPEGEQSLLEMIVNKIGDPTKKIAAAAGHELRNVLDSHPNMTKIVAREVSFSESFVRAFLLGFIVKCADTNSLYFGDCSTLTTNHT